MKNTVMDLAPSRVKALLVLIISLVSFGLMAQENFISIYVAPSARLLDWESPKKLYSSLRNSIASAGSSSTGLGHGIFQFSCTQEDGKRIELMSSYNGRKWNMSAALSVKLKMEGLKVLFDNVSNGYFTSQDSTRDFLENYVGRIESAFNEKLIHLRPKFIKIHVSPKQCSDAHAYYNFFLMNQMKFGFFAEPFEQYTRIKDASGKKQEISGGCTPFLVGLIKSIGHWDQLFDDKWIRKIKVSENWIGGVDKETGEKKRINLVKLIKSDDGAFWYKENEQTRSGSFADPELMWDFMDEASHCLSLNANEHINECGDAIKKWVRKNFVNLTEIKSKKGQVMFQGVEINRP
jgi:hypothetical protein